MLQTDFYYLEIKLYNLSILFHFSVLVQLICTYCN